MKDIDDTDDTDEQDRLPTYLTPRQCHVLVETAIPLLDRLVCPTDCTCDICVGMCRRSPCLGTPEDIMRLVEAGYQDKLVPTLNLGLRHLGYPAVGIIAPILTEHGCIFLENDRCTLHDKGLKPLEGRLQSCKTTNPIVVTAITVAILRTWNGFRDSYI